MLLSFKSRWAYLCWWM